MNSRLLLFLVLPFTAESICEVFMPYSSMVYLDQTQLARYRLTDPCTVTCTAGYTGDFCQNQVPFFTSLPMGPWNQAGYYTSGNGLLRTMSTSASSIDYIQYTKKDSILIGIQNAVTIVSSVVEIALYSRTVKPVMTPTPGGSFDSLLVRGGIAYLGRTTKIRLTATTTTDFYDVVVLSKTYSTQSLANTSGRVGLMEVFKDKGTVTVFAYLPSTNTIKACYPDGSCSTWATVEINGIACGADCPFTIYVSSLSKILRVRSTGYTMLRDTGSAIYCLTGTSTLNVLLYKSTSTMFQHNLATQTNNSIALGIADSGVKKICSLDISEQNNQILIVQDGVIRTLEAVQLLCGYGLTSQALQASSISACVQCPAPPVNAYWIEGSAVCEWVCLSQFTRVGSNCVAQTVMPCPAFFVPDASNSGLCIPSLLPWVAQGRYVASIRYATQLTLPGSSPPYCTAVIGASTLIQISMPNIFLSRNSGSTWTPSVSFAGAPDAPCGISGINRYYFVSSNSAGLLWTAFYYGSSPAQHCLWALNASSVVSQGAQLTVLQSWSLGGKLCSATGDLSFVYLLLCGTHSISSARMVKGSTLLPFAGSVQPGYSDASLRNSLFQSPSSMVLYDSRLYVADTGNCVIRELDFMRDTVNTVAGTHTLCQRVDDGVQRAALVAPNNLTYTSFPGIFLFVDKYASESNAVVRQFHVPTCTVQTISTMPSNYYSGILAVGASVMIRMEQNFVLLYATTAPCPNGTSSLAGGALTVSGCYRCGSGFYSDAAAGTCKNCSTPACGLGQMLVPCQAGADALCGVCTNKPAGNTRYIGSSVVPGTSDCPWAYTPPCPVGYYASNASLCGSCPAWTTSSAGSTSAGQCFCLGNGYWKDGGCVVPASLLFPILASCSAYAVDSPGGICPCEPGEFIQQINPKICEPCLEGYYSSLGTACDPCPDRTESSMDRTTCRCAGGLSDVSAVTSSMPQCACGPGKAFVNDPLTCVACEENKFNSAIINNDYSNPSSCLWCKHGTFSGSGASVCSKCPFSTYRIADSPLGCQDCPAGMYATDTWSYSCVDCSETCKEGMKETICPTDATRFICSDCLKTRANSNLNGGRDCATACNPGYFELDGECALCTVYNSLSCDKGNFNVPCSSYADAACMPCANSSMPLNYAVWKYTPLLLGGPNAVCEWECEAGYIPTQTPLPEGVPPAWECALAGAWNVWDLFTI